MIAGTAGMRVRLPRRRRRWHAWPELAAEKGMSTMNMSRWANHHGIPRRGRGGLSDTSTINAAKAAATAPRIVEAGPEVSRRR